jgi:hypothetical protein
LALHVVIVVPVCADGEGRFSAAHCGWPWGGSDGVVAGFAGADADDFLDNIGDEDLAVADRPVWAALRMASTTPSTIFVGEHDLDLHLGQEVDDIFGAAIEFGVALLAAEALGLGDGDALAGRLPEALPSPSSSLNGLMIASIFFIHFSLFGLHATRAAVSGDRQ